MFDYLIVGAGFAGSVLAEDNNVSPMSLIFKVSCNPLCQNVAKTFNEKSKLFESQKV